MFQSSNIKTHHGYMKNECLGKNETDLDSEGWSAMDFCIDKKESENLGYALLIFIAGVLGIYYIIPPSIYFLLGWIKFLYDHH